MQTELILHCFPGDTNSLSIILLAEYLNIDLKIRYLKPVNVAEKFYKVSLSKKFPMLEVKHNEGYYLIERSNCIMRFLNQTAQNNPISNRDQFSYDIGNQNLDFISHDIIPALVTLRALHMGIIEEDRQLDEQLNQDLLQKLTELELIIANQTDINLNHSDFLLYVTLRSAYDIPYLHVKLKSMKNSHARWQKLIEDAKFKSICAPFAPSLVK